MFLANITNQTNNHAITHKNRSKNRGFPHKKINKNQKKNPHKNNPTNISPVEVSAKTELKIHAINQTPCYFRQNTVFPAKIQKYHKSTLTQYLKCPQIVKTTHKKSIVTTKKMTHQSHFPHNTHKNPPKTLKIRQTKDHTQRNPLFYQKNPFKFLLPKKNPNQTTKTQTPHIGTKPTLKKP